MPGPLREQGEALAGLMGMQPEVKKKDPSIGMAPYAAHWGGELADLGTTIAALKSGRGRESNPLLGQNPWVMSGVKLGVAGALHAIMRHLDRTGHDKAAKIIGYVNGAAKGGIALHNSQVGRK